MRQATMLTALTAAMAIAATVQAEAAPNGHDLILRRLIVDATQGHIDYAAMTPTLAEAVHGQAGIAQSELSALGELKSVTLQRTDPGGAEFYRTDFEHGALEWAFSVNPQGLIDNANYRKPRPAQP